MCHISFLILLFFHQDSIFLTCEREREEKRREEKKRKEKKKWFEKEKEKEKEKERKKKRKPEELIFSRSRSLFFEHKN